LRAIHNLENDECEGAGLPHDPRVSFEWAFRVCVDDNLDSIITRAAYDVEGTDEDDNAILKQRKDEAAKLHQELESWRPKYKRAMELPKARVYAALADGKLTARGVLLPHVDHKKAIDDLAQSGKDLSDLPAVEIPREFWSQHQIFWELSAARNGGDHYCHIYCKSQDVMSVFPIRSLRAGSEICVERFGSYLVLQDADATVRGRTKPRSRSGRPPEYRWDEFHAEVASLIKRDALPEKKEAAIDLLRHWYVSRGQKPPGRTMIGEKLTVYYERFMRRAGRKTSSPITV
jgi:hypothetical protein